MRFLRPVFTWLLGVGACMALTACNAPEGGSSPTIRPGATLVLSKPVTVPAGERLVWFQGGATARFRSDRLAPYCRLHLVASANEVRTVQPGTFPVIWTRAEFETATAAGSRGIHLAAAGNGGAPSGGTPLSVSREIVMGLAAANGAGVDRLICGHHQPSGPYFTPDIKTINTVLGDYGRLDPPESQAN